MHTTLLDASRKRKVVGDVDYTDTVGFIADFEPNSNPTTQLVQNSSKFLGKGTVGQAWSRTLASFCADDAPLGVGVTITENMGFGWDGNMLTAGAVPPAINVPSGWYLPPLSVSMTTNGGSTIYYAYNIYGLGIQGEVADYPADPTDASTQYTVPLVFENESYIYTVYLKSISKNGAVYSAVATRIYHIQHIVT